MFKFHLLNVYLTLIYQVLGETENVKTNMFGLLAFMNPEDICLIQATLSSNITVGFVSSS